MGFGLYNIDLPTVDVMEYRCNEAWRLFGILLLCHDAILILIYYTKVLVWR